MMQAKTLVLVLGSVLFSVAGQLLLKSGTQRVSTASQSSFLLAAFRDAHVAAGLAAWIASTICWLYVLRVAPFRAVRYRPSAISEGESCFSHEAEPAHHNPSYPTF